MKNTLNNDPFQSRLFLVAGPDFEQRQTAVENIKKRIFSQVIKSSVNSNFPTSIFYAKEIDLKDFHEKLFTSSFDGARVSIIKESHALDKETREYLQKNIQGILTLNFMIFETEKDVTQIFKDKKLSADPFFDILLKRSTLCKAGVPTYQITLDEFIRKLRARDLSALLHILRKLFELEGSAEAKEFLGLKMLGILIGTFSYTRDNKEKQRCFDCLWTADRAIKERGLDTLLILEQTLIKLLRT